MTSRASLELVASGLSLVLLATGALAQTPPAGRAPEPQGRTGGRGGNTPPPVRPALLFREEWKQPPFAGALNDQTRRATQDAVTTPGLELKLYGPESRNVGVYNHEGRFDLWTGVTASPVAIMLKHTASYVDLTGLARLRAMIRTMSLHAVHPIVRLADGTYLAGSRRLDTEGEFLQVDVAFGGMRWFRVDPQKLVTTAEVTSPDLTRVDEVGFVDLAPGGGHGVSGAFNLSVVELYAAPIAR